MKLKIFGGLLVAVLAITSAAKAQTRTPVIHHREHQEVRRINRGVHNGQLTYHEAARLRHEQRHLRRNEHLARRDGHVTTVERRHLRHEEYRASVDIHRARHNGRYR